MNQLELTSELELTVNRTFAAPCEKVFNAWLSPQMLARFMRPCEGEGMDAAVENEPVEGGRFSIVMKLQDREVPHAGTYLEINPHSRLVFTWASPHSLDDSVVTIDFTAIDSRTTQLVLRQVKFASEQARDGHVAGWTQILGKLAAIIA